MKKKTLIDDGALIAELTGLDALAYARRKKDAAKALGISASELNKIVEAKRHAIKPDRDDGQGRTIKVVDPLPWHEPVSGDRLATTLAAAIKVYAVLSDEAADTITLWIMHTWAVDAFTVSPRLAFTSPTKGCGKTTLLRLLVHVVRRAKRSGSISPAALFRMVEKFQPTILLDETEKYIENGSDLHALLNEGHCKGGTVTRVIGDSLELREFSVFGAVAFARNGKLPDDLEQRSIIVEMQRRRADEPLTPLRDDRAEPLRKIASMCQRWADDYGRVLPDQDDPDMDMINRNADNWRPLFVVADLCGEDWPDRVRQAAALLAPRESESTGPKLLADIRTVYAEQKTDRLFSTDICDALASIEGRPWAEWGKARKPISKNQLAGLLRPYHIVPGTMRIGTERLNGYHLHQFAEAFERYLASDLLYETCQRDNATATDTFAGFRNVTPDPNVTFQKCEKPLPDGACHVVTDEKGGASLSFASPPRCAQCGGDPDGEEKQFLINGATYWLHPQCRRFFQPQPQEQTPRLSKK